MTGALEWAVAERTLRGETESGDLYLVAPFADGALAAVIDGLGHGPEAAQAARAARAILSEDPGAPAEQLMRRCHEGLRGTRGVVLSLASINTATDTLTWVGVGDVEGLLLRGDPAARPASQSILLRGGVVGYQLPPLHEARHALAPDDMLILATDGVRRDFLGQTPCEGDVQAIADTVIFNQAKSTDDALVLIARYRGGGA